MIRSLKELQPDLSWHVPHLDKAPRPRPHLSRSLTRPLYRPLRRPELVHPNPSKHAPFEEPLAA
ncbi:MAG: hypothetical protein EA397_00460 [Deltaproteobacteria bacterium]|nr:MAG: hypothetical protein EA397_00460 [Deltaproteobacteria bacterium]